MKNIKGILGVILFIMIDQVTKYLAQINLQNKKPISVIKNVFSLHYLENTGAAFGILQNQMILFIILTLITVFIIGYVYIKSPNTKKYRPLRILLVFLSAGAIGNLIDRIINNYVVDFLYFELINFPIFNIADCYVTISAAVLIILGLFYYKEADFAFLDKKKEKKGE